MENGFWWIAPLFWTIQGIGVVLIILKIIGIIHWRWLWILSPSWGSAALMLAFMVLLYISFATGGL